MDYDDIENEENDKNLEEEWIKVFDADTQGDNFLTKRLVKRRQGKNNNKQASSELGQSINKHREFGIAEPACPADTSWRLLTWAYDINGTMVRVYQPPDGPDGELVGPQQWFYTVQCRNKHMVNFII